MRRPNRVQIVARSGVREYHDLAPVRPGAQFQARQQAQGTARDA